MKKWRILEPSLERMSSVGPAFSRLAIDLQGLSHEVSLGREEKSRAGWSWGSD